MLLTSTVHFITAIWALHTSITHGSVADAEAVLTSELIALLLAFLTSAVQITILAGTGENIKIHSMLVKSFKSILQFIQCMVESHSELYYNSSNVKSSHSELYIQFKQYLVESFTEI